MSKILVIGATGKTGLQIVERALAVGHDVTAFARHAVAMADLEGLTKRTGDVLDADAVDAAVRGHDAVLVSIGPVDGSPPDLCARATMNVVAAMRRHGVRRLVCMTGALIGHPAEHLGWMYRFMRAMTPARVLDDRRAQERIVRESGLDWTLVRPTRLTDEPSRELHVGEDVDIGAFAHVARSEVARFMVDQIGREELVGHAVAMAA